MLLFRVIHVFAAAFFILAAYVQTNDPDPELWVPIYLFPATTSLVLAVIPQLSYMKTFNLLMLVMMFFYAAFSAYILKNNFNFNANIVDWLVHDEAGREYSGLWIIIFWCLLMQSNIWQKPDFVYCMWASLILVLPASLWAYVYLDKNFRSSWPQHCQTVLYSDRSVSSPD